MNRLQPQFYVCFPVKQAKFSMILMDLGDYPRLLRNARFVKFLIENPSHWGKGHEMGYIFQSMKDYQPRPTPFDEAAQKDLSYLHLTTDNESRPFVPEIEEEPKPHLITERFFWYWPTVNIGSARHALLLDMQLKGIGRNPLAIRNDHFHSWGGQYLWQAMKAYVISKMYEGAAPLGLLKTSYVAVRDEDIQQRQIKTSAVSFSARDADALRVCQVMAQFDPSHSITREEVLKQFLKNMRVKSSSEQMEKIIFHYSVLLLMGVRHMSITRENVTLEGKLIDYEDMIQDAQGDIFKVFVMTSQCWEDTPKEYRNFKGERVFATSLHFYLDAIELTALGLSQLDPDFKRGLKQLKSDFAKMLNILSKTIFDIDPELMFFLKLMLKQVVGYDKGDTLTQSKVANAKELLS
nr:hypothetical protein [Bdellovibrionales bacterium]